MVVSACRRLGCSREHSWALQSVQPALPDCWHGHTRLWWCWSVTTNIAMTEGIRSQLTRYSCPLVSNTLGRWGRDPSGSTCPHRQWDYSALVQYRLIILVFFLCEQEALPISDLFLFQRLRCWARIHRPQNWASHGKLFSVTGSLFWPSQDIIVNLRTPYTVW